MLDRTHGLRFAGELRAAGLNVLTLAEIWGKQEAQSVVDPIWIRHAAENGYVGVTADDDLRYTHKEALAQTGLQVLCFPNGNLPWRTQVERMLGHLPAIELLVTEVPGTWMAKLYHDAVEIVWPPALRSMR